MPASFVMAGGGTGGHVIPALAVAHELRTRGHDVHFIGTRRGLEAKLVPQTGFAIDWIEISGLNRVGISKMLTSLTELPRSTWQAAKVLSRVKPAAVFSMGGYVAGPVLLAAWMKRVPIVAMEPNAIPGFTHRRMASVITRALVSFQETARWFQAGTTEVTGMPVRSEFFAVPQKIAGEEITILITGGSQGSRTLNRAAEESWPLWSQMITTHKIRLIHQAGRLMYSDLAPRFANAGIAGEIHEFIIDMPAAFVKADLIVSRSGMGTVSEIAAAGKASILVPFPGAADDHQHKNAEVMKQAGAAKLVLDSEMNGRRLVEEVARVIESQQTIQRMAAAARTLAKPNAAQRAAEILEGFM